MQPEKVALAKPCGNRSYAGAEGAVYGYECGFWGGMAVLGFGALGGVLFGSEFGPIGAAGGALVGGYLAYKAYC